MNAQKQRPLQHQMPQRPHTTHVERVYVKVNSDFDSSGYLQPRSITWLDGRTFTIDAVTDFRPKSVYHQGSRGSCYTVVIKGEERRLYFERTDKSHTGLVGRWYVETEVAEGA